MATLVSFHAHPDDESIGAGGTLAKAVAEGHRVVLVFATRGEHGEVPDGLLEPGEHLWERRIAETAEAAGILGVHRVEFLGYVDSGLMGAATNNAPASFWQADVQEVAQRLAAILVAEGADVLTVYDREGVTGHPDHIQVYRVGVRAAALAGTPRVYEGTLNRTKLMALAQKAATLGVTEAPKGIDLERLGMPEQLITTKIDVRDYLEVKRRAMAAHASQISETSLFLAIPDEAFTELWGTEWFIRRDAEPGTVELSLFEGLG